MALIALGVNHQTAGVDVREKLVFDVQNSIEHSRGMIGCGLVTEAVILSTCNRTELYCEAPTPSPILEYIIGQKKVTPELIQPSIYTHLNVDAAKHLMRVASGLDSMILGEAEILGQIKKAYAVAANAGTVGKHLGRLFQTAFAIAKQARTNTGIGINPVSVAFAAAKLSQHIFSDLSKITVLLIGAGDLIQLIARHLVNMGVKNIMVANRTQAHAIRLALPFEGKAFGLEKIPECLAEADIVITGAASVLPIVGKGMVESALRQRKRRPMFMVDLAVPRNIETEVNELEDIYLYCIDDLESIVEENKRFRLDAAQQAELIIKEAADKFMDWLDAQDSFRMLSHFRGKFEQIRDQLLQDSLHAIQLGETAEAALKRLAHSLTNRFLHEPTRRLRKAGFEKEEALLSLIKELFELNHENLYTK